MNIFEFPTLIGKNSGMVLLLTHGAEEGVYLALFFTTLGLK